MAFIKNSINITFQLMKWANFAAKKWSLSEIFAWFFCKPIFFQEIKECQIQGPLPQQLKLPEQVGGAAGYSIKLGLKSVRLYVMQSVMQDHSLLCYEIWVIYQNFFFFFNLISISLRNYFGTCYIESYCPLFWWFPPSPTYF